MRLIDADELKKALNKMFDITDVLLFDDITETIDNAPTVEPFERIGAICNENCGVYRPQGEWQPYMTGYQGDKVTTITYRCSNCNRYIVYVSKSEKSTTEFLAKYPYCHCGAKMNADQEVQE